MVAPGEETRATAVLLPSGPTRSLLSQENGTSDGETLGQQNLFKQDGNPATDQVERPMHTGSVQPQTSRTPYATSLFLTL